LLTAVAGISVGSAVPASAFEQGIAKPEKRVLVAYFSRTGNTRVVAGLIQRAFGADLFEIVPTAPYPDEYLATVEQARQERDRGS
jgi:Flavodoxin